MRQFHIRIRVVEAIKMFAAGARKITAVARLVGYKSDKNFYRALRAVTGLTPSALMMMGPESLGKLAAAILPLGAALELTVP
jgi:AraC-like DNA-binding protein